MRQKILSAITLTALAGVFLMAGCSQQQRTYSGDPIPLQSQHGILVGELRGDVTLSTQQSDVPIGQYILLNVRFHNAGATQEFYNPKFDAAFPAPAVLAIYNAKHQYLGNLLPAGQAAIPPSNAWVEVPISTMVEGGISVPTDYFPSKPDMQLKPGIYTLQLIYTQAFIAASPATSQFDASLFDQQLSHVGVMCSNPVQIKISPLVPK